MYTRTYTYNYSHTNSGIVGVNDEKKSIQIYKTTIESYGRNINDDMNLYDFAETLSEIPWINVILPSTRGYTVKVLYTVNVDNIRDITCINWFADNGYTVDLTGTLVSENIKLEYKNNSSVKLV